MRSVAGAIVVLASAVLCGAGALAGAVQTASGKAADGPPVALLFGGAIVGIVGFSLVFTGPREERRM